MKYWLFILSAFGMSYCTFAAGSYSWTDPETGIRWRYYIDDDNIVTLEDRKYVPGYGSCHIPVISDSLTGELIIPEMIDGLAITKIGESAFGWNKQHWTYTVSQGCRGLTSILIPSGVDTIADYAFHYCTALTKISIPSNVVSIGEKVFSYCTSLSQVVLAEGIKSIGAYAFEGCTSLTSITVPSSVTTSEMAFSNSNVTDVILSEGFLSIGSNMFADCKDLEIIQIPASLTSSKSGAFRGCENLKKVQISDLALWCLIDFADSDSNPLNFSADLCVNDSVVTDIKIPTSTTQVKSRAFLGYKKLKSVEIGENVQNIGDAAFKDCSELKSVVLLDGVKIISDNAFQGCSMLSSITIPASVTSIGANAFPTVTEVIFKGRPPTINKTAFPNIKDVKYTSHPLEWQQFYAQCVESHILNPDISWTYIGSDVKALTILGGGSVSVNTSTYQYGESISVTATPKEGYVFLGWSSDVEGIGGSEPTLTFTVPERDEVLLIANFFPKALLTTLVNETLNATLDAKVDARIEAKIDGESLLTAEQAATKTSATIEAKVADGELITSDQLQVMAMEAPVIAVEDGKAKVGVSLKRAESLEGEWEEVAAEEAEITDEGAISVSVPADGNAAFYKFVVPEKQ